MFTLFSYTYAYTNMANVCSAHWTLFVICLAKNKVYHFDSARKPGGRGSLMKNVVKK